MPQLTVVQPARSDARERVDARIAAEERRGLLRFLTCGSVDDGKSTLIGWLLYDSELVYQDQVKSAEHDSRRALGARGGPIDLSLLVEFSDRIAIMYAGQIVESAPARELFDTPLHPYTRGLMRSFPALTGEKQHLSGIPGSPPDMLHPPTGCRFHPRCPLVRPMHTRVVPALREAKPGHFVACHLYEAMGNGALQ